MAQWWKGALTLVVFFRRRVVGTPLHDLLHVFGLHVDGHCSDDAVGGRWLVDPEADGAGGCHAHKQLL